MGIDRHDSRELTIFRRFAAACPHAIRAETIQKQASPAPDIRCEGKEGPIAFELVESIDEDLGRAFNMGLELKERLTNSYRRLPAGARSGIRTLFGHAIIHVTFQKELSQRKREAAVPKVLDELLEMPEDFLGTYRPKRGDRLAGCVHRLIVARGDFNGPIFDVDMTTSIADPIMEQIEKKFRRPYQSDVPMELLVYYELQPKLIERTGELGTVMESVAALVDEKTTFRRVWVFDWGTSKIMGVHPAVEDGATSGPARPKGSDHGEP